MIVLISGIEKNVVVVLVSRLMMVVMLWRKLLCYFLFR